MNLTVAPGTPLIGEVIPPGDKSISHRAALFAALAEGESLIEGFLVSGVTQVMLAALQELGVPWALDENILHIKGQGLAGLRLPSHVIDCGNSATTLRFLAGALAAAGLPAVLDGSPGLRLRPMARILQPLREMGVAIEAAPGETVPLHLGARKPGRKLLPLEYTLPVASAQLKTCLLLAALAASGPTTLHEMALSRDHSERLLRVMGVPVEICQSAQTSSVKLYPAERLSPLRLRIPGDFSSAAFLIVAALITPGSAARLIGVGLNPTRTGLLDILKEMGADIQVVSRMEQDGEPVGDLFVSYSALHGVQVDGQTVVRMIDEFPALAIAAAYAKGVTRVRGAIELRYKESDRIASLCKQLHTLGVNATELQDGFTIRGGRPIRGGIVDPQGDHRLAMALAISGLAAQEPVTVLEAGIIAESYPGFPSALRALGASIRFS